MMKWILAFLAPCFPSTALLNTFHGYRLDEPPGFSGNHQKNIFVSVFHHWLCQLPFIMYFLRRQHYYHYCYYVRSWMSNRIRQKSSGCDFPSMPGFKHNVWIKGVGAGFKHRGKLSEVTTKHGWWCGDLLIWLWSKNKKKHNIKLGFMIKQLTLHTILSMSAWQHSINTFSDI